MPTSKVTAVTISHQWDDDSSSDIIVSRGSFSDLGPYVSIKEDGGDCIYIRPESWPEIRDQAQGFFDDMAEDNK